MTLSVPLHQPSFFRAAALVLHKQWAAVRTYLDKTKINPVAEIRNTSEEFFIDCDTLPMVDQGASASILLAEFWSSEDPKKSTPWSPTLHDAAHQAEVAVPQLFNIFAACNADT